jgi:hypothetical protein
MSERSAHVPSAPPERAELDLQEARAVFVVQMQRPHWERLSCRRTCGHIGVGLDARVSVFQESSPMPYLVDVANPSSLKAS